ncbi:thermonuclease family protein [Labrenzia sp. ac12]|uniref:thermonuclease family protein n=1 Tax=Labrenzia sp. THAF35 TaxID=2587854 RepID=UPI00257010AD|nr:thermonuclease family protein [Labrenzia sp. THAF35]
MFWSALAILWLLSPVHAAATIRVIDGDTIELSGTVYRLHGIDAPEAGQTCKTPSGGSWKCGQAAIDAIERLVSGKLIVCDRRDRDVYDRIIGVCTADGRDINADMVSMGLARAFRNFPRIM